MKGEGTMPRSRAGAVLATLCLLAPLGAALPARAQSGALNNRIGGFGPPPGRFDNRLNGSSASTGGPAAAPTAPATAPVQDQGGPDTGAPSQGVAAPPPGASPQARPQPLRR
jgi:hypothetical protein